MNGVVLFRIASLVVVGLFLWFGMDVRRKPGSRDFVAPVWQTLMKLAAFSLIGAFASVALALPAPHGLDWLALAIMGAGTAFVVAAKRALGTTHTFAGQYREQPRFVTTGVYALTRNPLYFGVFLCELGALLCAAPHAPELFPRWYPYWAGLVGIGLVYAVSFNWTMARREARELERQLGENYRRYRAHVPFLIPFTK